MNRLELRTEVRAELGETTENFWKNTELNAWLNEACLRFASEHRWPWLITESSDPAGVAADVATYSFSGTPYPRAFNLMLTATGSTIPIVGPKRVSPVEGFNLRRTNTTTGIPLYYYLTASTMPGGNDGTDFDVKFVPTPSQDYDIDWQIYRAPDLMSTDTNEPEFPIEYQYGLVAWTAYKAWNKELKDQGKAQAAVAEYQKIVESARMEYANIPEDTILSWGAEEPEGAWGNMTGDEYHRMQIGELGP